METKEKEQGIFIPMEIWTIKKMNLNEKIILSDICNKSQLKDFKGYVKKIDTLANENGINKLQVEKTLKNLTKKGLIYSKVVRKKQDGKIKTIVNYRAVNYEALVKAEKFKIDDENRFFKKNKKGIFINYIDLQALNSWYISRQDDKKNYKKLQLENFILFLILKRVMFFDEKTLLYLARFKKNELAEFTDIARQTIYNIIESLLKHKNNITRKKEIKGAKLYKLKDFELDIFEGMLREFIDPSYYENYFDDTDLYLINSPFLNEINLNFRELNNITNLDV